MLEFQEKRKIRNLMYSKTSVVVLLIIMFFMGKGVYGVYSKQQASQENFDRVEVSLEDLKDREKMLKIEIERLNTEKGIENEIRDKYNVVLPNEEIIMIVDKNATGSNNNSGTPNTKSFWQKMFGWF